MKTPDREYGQDQQREIRNGVQDSGRQDHHVHIYAMSMNVRVPDFLARYAREDLEKGVRQVECGVEPEKAVDEDVHPTSFGWSKNAEVKQQNGQLGDEYQGAVHDLGRVGELVRTTG